MRDAMVLIGAGLVSYGAWSAWSPAGFIVGGGFLLGIGLVGSLRSQPKGGGEP
jgi:hypothetical protein